MLQKFAKRVQRGELVSTASVWAFAFAVVYFYLTVLEHLIKGG